MPDRDTWNVSPIEDGWEIKKPGNERASGKEESKSEAISRAKEFARNNKPSQVDVRREDGTVQETLTFG